MAIKMRICKDGEARCKICGQPREKSLEIFEISFTDKQIIRICDLCNDELFNKTLRASCIVNHRAKSPLDMKIISNRKRKLKK